MPIARGATVLAASALITGRPRPDSSAHVVGRNLYNTGRTDVVGVLAVTIPRVPSGSELVRVNIDVAENFEKNALTVASGGISGVVATHTALINATVGTADNLESVLLIVLPGSAPVKTPMLSTGDTATVVTASVRTGLSSGR